MKEKITIKILSALINLYTNTLFIFMKFIKQSFPIIVILAITGLFLIKAKNDIWIQFRIEFLGIVYTIIIIELIFFIRENNNVMRYKKLFLFAIDQYISTLCQGLAKSYNMYGKTNISLTEEHFRGYFDEMSSKDRLSTLAEINNFFIYTETMSKQLIEVYGDFLDMNLKGKLYDISLKCNNNNFYKKNRIYDLIITKDENQLDNLCVEIGVLFNRNLKDDEKLNRIIRYNLDLNALMYFLVVKELKGIERYFRKNYKPFYKNEDLKYF